MNYNYFSFFQIVQTPQAIANPAAIFAKGAMNNIIRPRAIQTAPSHDVLSLILDFNHFIVFSFVVNLFIGRFEEFYTR